MAYINEATEIRTQAMLPRSSHVIVEDSGIYTNIFFLRYVEGSKHIAGDSGYRFIGQPDRWYWLPGIVREIFAPKEYVVRLPSPMCWDNDTDPIPEEELKGILLRIEKGLRKKHKRYKIEFEQ